MILKGSARLRLCCLAALLLLHLAGCSPCPCRTSEGARSSTQTEIGETPPDDSALAIDRGAAIEAARAFGLAEGLGPWGVRLKSDGHRGWLWVVTNIISDDGAGNKSGRSMTISADSGELVDEVEWAATP